MRRLLAPSLALLAAGLYVGGTVHHLSRHGLSSVTDRLYVEKRLETSASDLADELQVVLFRPGREMMYFHTRYTVPAAEAALALVRTPAHSGAGSRGRYAEMR